jgi:hypothetical protein
MLGCIDFGRFPTTAITVRNAARVGADFARRRLYPANDAPESAQAQKQWRQGLRDAVLSEMRGLKGFDESQLTRLHVTGLDPGGNRYQVRVEVGYRFKTLINLVDRDGQLLPNQLDLRQEVWMDIQKYPGVNLPPDTDL